LVHYIPLAIYYIKLKMITRHLSVLDIVIIIVLIIVAAIVIYLFLTCSVTIFHISSCWKGNLIKRLEENCKSHRILRFAKQITDR
ncbi:MAG: hypothetical protein ACJ71I_05020, partial [Nitrososphaeraceae archaeon]